MSTLSENLQLLLANPTNVAPALTEGLSLQTLPAMPALDTERYRDALLEEIIAEPRPISGDLSDPNDLGRQRWGVIVPEGPRGDRLLALMRPLIALREDEQGARAWTFRLPSALNYGALREWQLRLVDEVGPRDNPRYLLILGDVTDISLDTDIALSMDALVGRFHAETDEGYAAYAEKVCRWAQKPQDEPARVLFQSANDGSGALALAHHNILMPCRDSLLKWVESNELTNTQIGALDDGIVGRDEFLEQARAVNSSIVLSIGHGLGAPPEGWSSLDELRKRQGSLRLGSQGILEASDVQTGAFHAGSIWIPLASYSAATPVRSVYGGWLEDIVSSQGAGGEGQSVLTNLGRAIDRPFLSSMALAALANPDGPLAVIGKKDLAWTYTLPQSSMKNGGGAEGMARILRALARGWRLGAAFHEWWRLIYHAAAELDELRDRIERGKRRGQPVEVDPARGAFSWLLRNDAASYMLLGDPAIALGKPRRSRE